MRIIYLTVTQGKGDAVRTVSPIFCFFMMDVWSIFQGLSGKGCRHYLDIFLRGTKKTGIIGNKKTASPYSLG